MRTWEVARFGFGEDSTLGMWYRVTDEGRKRLCFNLEDERRVTKVAGETCIPVGTYTLKLRTDGRNATKYGERWDWHKGMIELVDVKDFVAIQVHPGNTDDDTRGCLLPGRVPLVYPDGEFRVGKSSGAYRMIYEEIVPHLIAGEKCVLHVTEVQPWA
jgi:hypothetical protein